MVAAHDLVLAIISGAAGKRIVIIHHPLARHGRHEACRAQRAAVGLRARRLHQLRAGIEGEALGQALRPFHAVIQLLGAVGIAALGRRLLARHRAQRDGRRHRFARGRGGGRQQFAACLSHGLRLRLGCVPAHHRHRATGGLVGGAYRIAIGLPHKLRIDQDRIIERPLHRRVSRIIG